MPAGPKLKVMVSSSVYGSQSLLRQAYATLLSFGYDVICSPVGTMAAMDRRERKEIHGDWGVRSENARERRERLALERDLEQMAVLEFETDAGELKLVPEPAGTGGYDDLRRAARREPLGQGLRPQVASLGDQARMLAALDREQDLEALRTLRRLIELEQSISRGIDLGL